MSLATHKYQAIVWIAVVSRVTVWVISQSADRLAADYDTSSGLQPLECSSVDVQSIVRVKGPPDHSCALGNTASLSLY